MPRYNYKWNEEKIRRYIKEGRGKGEFEQYQPWLTVRDVPSTGRVARIPGTKINRIYHTLSDLERNAFLIFEWSDKIIDIREQYPILDRDKTAEIADILGFKHPVYPNTKTKTVVTLDFLLTAKDKSGKLTTYARSIKPSSELTDERTIQKLLIERQYFMQEGINWAVITEKEIPKVLANNLYDLRDSKLYISEIDQQLIHEINELFLNQNPESKIIDSVVEIGRELYVSHEKVLKVLHYLVYNKKIRINLNEKLNFHQSWKEGLID